MNKIRLTFIITTLFAAGNALAVGSDCIGFSDGVCNIDPTLLYVDRKTGQPVYGSVRSDNGNTMSYTIARQGQLIKAHCLIRNTGLDLQRAASFDQDTVPGRRCRIRFDQNTAYNAFDYHGNFTPSSNATLNCTCDLGNGCYPD
jgi:hypothetical protein